ncbi:hypothetical protein T07_7008 [Trichinella nelsoni]|uniref:Uncharacterized protein n=1 Tax=Trichinella nelsoni TaxID=6336 RepID=A0A0V0RNC0_9BILA|nr:hypothetical protein T07_7008 [Trichinella nelsoni]
MNVTYHFQYSNSKGCKLSVISGFEILCLCSALHYSPRQDVHALRYFKHMIEKDTMHKNACINRSNVHLEIDTLHIAKKRTSVLKLCQNQLGRKCRRIDEATGFELGFVVAVLEHKWKNYRNLSSAD